MNANGRKSAVLVAVIAALFMVAFAYQAGAAPFTYVGKVISIDQASKILTVQAGPNDQHIFSMNSGATILKCSKPEAWGNIKVGDKVSVNYFEKSSGNYVANNISLLPAMGQHC
jgi:hypothetical protein